MNTQTAVPVMNDLSSSVRDVFARVTRYPLEVLDPNAGLEEDLGIDSVKLGEVFAVLREQYALPEQLDIPRESFRTIAGITEALQDYLAKGPGVVAVAAKSGNGHRAKENGFGGVPAIQEIFAQVTRYPLEVLDPNSALEEDLGIDSVKLGEVFAVMREKYSLPEQLDIPRESFRTIASITEALQDYLGGAAVLKAEENAPPQTEDVFAHPSGNGNGFKDPATVQTSVLEVFAQVTRYPLEVLDPAAGLEEDLGIDSVKLGEVFAVLREKYSLPENLDIPREKFRSIGSISEALSEYISTSTAPTEPFVSSAPANAVPTQRRRLQFLNLIPTDISQPIYLKLPNQLVRKSSPRPPLSIPTKRPPANHSSEKCCSSRVPAEGSAKTFPLISPSWVHRW